LPEHERVCLVCTSDDNLENVVNQEVEDEFHYIFSCNRYDAIRTLWLSKLSLPENFSNFEKSEKLKFVLNEPDDVKLTAQFIIDVSLLYFCYLNCAMSCDSKTESGCVKGPWWPGRHV
jgi:hypothetical protein